MSKDARKVMICQDRGVDLVCPTLACVFDVVLFAAVSVAPLDSGLTSNLSNRLFYSPCVFLDKKKRSIHKPRRNLPKCFR